MKKLLVLLPMIFFTLIACRGNGDDEIDNSFLLGNWNWKSTIVGSNPAQTPVSTGKTVILTMNQDKTYEIKENGVVKSTGTYVLFEEISNIDHQNHTFIDFSADPDRMIETYSSNDLYLTDDLFNGISEHYQK